MQLILREWGRERHGSMVKASAGSGPITLPLQMGAVHAVIKVLIVLVNASKTAASHPSNCTYLCFYFYFSFVSIYQKKIDN